MQIDFASSGGVKSVELTYRADTTSWPEPEAKELIPQIESSEAFDLQRHDINPNVTVRRADVLTYRLTLSDGNRQTNLWMDDVTAPAAVRPLLALLQNSLWSRNVEPTNLFRISLSPSEKLSILEFIDPASISEVQHLALHHRFQSLLDLKPFRI